jgi:hypothetical protein
MTSARVTDSGGLDDHLLAGTGGSCSDSQEQANYTAKVMAMFEGSGFRVQLVRDEFMGFLAGLNYDAGLAFWLEAYGSRPYRVEHQKHPEPIVSPRMTVAVSGGT